MTRNLKLAFALSLLAVPALASAQPPVQNIDPARHGNLAAAQQLSREAYDRISAAQYDNRGDMDGYAARAKQLLVQVNQTLRLAADAANANR